MTDVVQPSPQTTEALLEAIEKDLLELIVEHLKNNALSLEQAQSLAKEFLSILPVSDKVDLLHKMGVLSQKYPEAQAIYAKYAGGVDNEIREEKLTKISDMIKTGNIEGAITVAKKGTTS